MSNPPQDPNQPRDPEKYPYGNEPDQPGQDPQQPGQSESGDAQPDPAHPAPNQPPYGQPQYGQQAPSDRPQYNQPQYGEHAPNYGQPRPGQSVAGGQPPMEHQNPAGQPQSPYGYQTAQPSGYGYPGGGQAQFQQPGPVSRPKEVNIAFWLIIAAAIGTALSAILSLAAIGSPGAMQQFEEIMSQQPEGASVDPNAVIGIASTFLVIVTLIGIGIYLLIAFMVRKGKNWARITATVLAALSLMLLIGGTFLTWIVVLLGIAAVVLLYMPASTSYFNAVKAQKFGAYGQ